MAGRGTSSVGFKLANILRERVAAGRYQDRFPTEAELIAEFGMSRYAVRSAMQRLESDGQIDRRPGRGTSLAERAPDAGGWAIRTVQDLIDRNLLDRPTVLSARPEPVAKHPGIAQIFELGPRARVFVVERLGHSHPGEIPFFSRNFMPVEVGRALPRQGTAREPLVIQIEKARRIRLHRVRQEISGGAATHDVAHHLKVAAGYPIIVVRRSYYGWDGDAVVLGDLYYRLEEFRQAIDLFRQNG